MALTIHSDSVKMSLLWTTGYLLPASVLSDNFCNKINLKRLEKLEDEGSEGNCKAHKHAVGGLTFPN